MAVLPAVSFWSTGIWPILSVTYIIYIDTLNDTRRIIFLNF